MYSELKKLVIAAIIITSTAIAIQGASAKGPQNTESKTTGKQGRTQIKPDTASQKAMGTDQSIYEAGSSAAVRHERTGSLNPGHAKSTGAKPPTGPTGK